MTRLLSACPVMEPHHAANRNCKSSIRIALIADIHGNRVALDAILDDMATERVDQIICLGDVVAFGPQPAEVIVRLRDIGCPVVKGDTDASLLWPEAPATDVTLRRLQEIDRWARERLTLTDRDFLASFPSTVAVALAPDVSLLCYHGSPRSFKDRITATTSAEELDCMVDGAVAQLYAGEHRHLQMVQRHRDALLLNPGSVGLAYDRVPSPDLPAGAICNPPWGEYAILTVAGDRFSVDLRRVSFDVRALLQCAHGNDMPHAHWWYAEWDNDL